MPTMHACLAVTTTDRGVEYGPDLATATIMDFGARANVTTPFLGASSAPARITGLCAERCMAGCAPCDATVKQLCTNRDTYG